MTARRRRKSAIILLAIYLPVLFVLSHIPIPAKVHNAGVSDKVLHFLAYLVLVFLFWIALNPERKVCWRERSPWAVVLIMLAYGIIDEVLQGFVGRSCDARDLAADLIGVFAGLILLTFFTVRLAAVIVCGMVIFGITNVAKVKPADYVTLADTVFHLVSYAVFTLLWIHCMRRFPFSSVSKWQWLAVALAMPAALLLAVKGYSISLGKEF
ncbi:MAG: VanZ family protein, partial [Planctomycetota bacterium]